MQHRGEFISINKDSGCEDKDDVLEEVTKKKTQHERNSQIFHDIEGIKDEMLRSDPNLESNMAILQSTEKSFGKRKNKSYSNYS